MRIALPRLWTGVPGRRIALPRLWPKIVSGKRIGRYTRAKWPWPAALLFYFVVIAFSLVYGFTFGIFSYYSLVPFMVPLLVLALIAIWTMPQLRYPPVRALASLLTAYMFALLVWPDYIALSLSGLPWITAQRLIGLPMLTILAICYITSPRFRAQLYNIAGPTKEISWTFLGFVLVVTLTLALSKDIGGSLQRYFVFAYTNFAAFFASIMYFRKAKRVYRFSLYLVIIAVISILIGCYEIAYQHLPWAGRIPSFLAIQDPSVLKLLAGTARAGNGRYRIQSKFSTSIGLGEFLGLALPFMLHLLFVCKSRILKLFLLALIPLAFIVTIATQSRLAFVCFLSSFMLYVLFRALLAWRKHTRSLFAPAVALAYPLFLLLFLAGTFVWPRLSQMVWGGGAEQASTESRKIQWHMMWPLLFRNPLGYGLGRSGATLNYIAKGYDAPTVDSYYISILLETGVLGFFLFYGAFAIGIIRSGLTALKAKDDDLQFLIAACIALINFVLSKSVYSQTENHPLAFIILGMVVALIRQYKTDTGELPPPPTEDELLKPKKPDLSYSQ